MAYGHCIVVRVYWESVVNISCFIHAFTVNPLSFTIESSYLMDYILREKQWMMFRENKIKYISLVIKLTKLTLSSNLSWFSIKIYYKNMKYWLTIFSLNFLYEPEAYNHHFFQTSDLQKKLLVVKHFIVFAVWNQKFI